MIASVPHGLLVALLCLPHPASESPPKNPDQPAPNRTSNDEKTAPPAHFSAAFKDLKLRALGPALQSGRIGDLAMHPTDPAIYYAAASSGGVWKTINHGTTFEPIFDEEGSYSIGCLAIDPNNPNRIWVGTGENNSQRSVSFGDGVYRSNDGGASFEKVGLDHSEHIGMIAVDPRDSDVVYVAAQGPLWRSGGDRGLYKTEDGGATWERILHISDDTGINEVHLDPRDPDILYASAYQRRRHVWTLINGGPESGIHKSEDGGLTWRELTSGIPEVDKGRIGLDISPANPDLLYAIIEAAEGKGGLFRSEDRGETWEKRSDYMTSSPQYYNELVCDPKRPDRVYALDTYLHRSDDGGKSFDRMPREDRHVDDHALWIDPQHTDHLIVGSDGGIYETWDDGEHWQYKQNLPITQFYRLAVDNQEPFYFIYGGTQDNNTIGGPSRTKSPMGIANEDWFITVGGDGFKPQIDPTDPNIVYSQWQYGGLVRHNRRTGENVDIKPREKPDEPGLKWNWDSPLLISPHSPTRLYYGANRLFRSDDRGDRWEAISDDLTRGLDRDQLPVMDTIQSVDAVARHRSTSMYGNSVALTESPLREGLLYVGTDDGLVHVTEDGGESWRKIERFPGVPERTYVSCLVASHHQPDRVFAAFDHHKNGDFQPYLLRSDDRGQSWSSIAGDLGAREIVYSVAEDHVNPDLLFVGTEFGLYFTVDGGEHWTRLKNGLPTIAVRDLEIQRRENDLALATFGRGFYVLDDYTPLRHLSAELVKQEAALLPVKRALQYVPTGRFPGSGRGSQGASFYTAENPPYGAIFTYHLKEKLQSRTERRRQREKESRQRKEPVVIPSFDELREEDWESEPKLFLVVRDPAGEIVRRLSGPRDAGLHRVAWNLRLPSASPTSLKSAEERPEWMRADTGPMALPGRYSVTLTVERDGVVSQLAGPEAFDVVPLTPSAMTDADREAVMAFRLDVKRLRRAVTGAAKGLSVAKDRLRHLEAAISNTENADEGWSLRVEQLERRLMELDVGLNGDQTKRSRSAPTPPSITDRVEQIVNNQWDTTEPPTATERDQYRYAADAFTPVLAALRSAIEVDLAQLEREFEAAGAPWTPGRLPLWPPE